MSEDNKKMLYESKDGTKQIFIDGNKIGFQMDEHTKAEINLAEAGQKLGEYLAKADYSKIVKNIKKGSKWLKFAGILSKIKRK